MVEIMSMYMNNLMLIIGKRQHMQAGGYRQNIDLINWWVSGVESFSRLGKND